jgi:acyl-CoA thioester hydrolase
MPPFTATCEVRWADLDANGHARHTAFLDWATHCRVAAFGSQGLTMARFAELGVGPVIFREEADYLREVGGNDRITISCQFTGASPDWKHFRIRHELARGDGEHCATVVVRGSWLDLAARRVVAPPAVIVQACAALPRSPDFEVLGSPRR